MDLSWGTNYDDAFNTGMGGGGGGGLGGGGMGPQTPLLSSNKPHGAAPALMQSPLIAQQAAQQQQQAAAAQFVATAQASQDASNAAFTPNPFILDPKTGAGPPLVPASPGYFERLGARKKDVVKYVVLGLMVTLGLSLHWLVSHYMTVWIENSDFEGKHELFARCVYPLGVVLLLWNFKAFQ